MAPSFFADGARPPVYSLSAMLLRIGFLFIVVFSGVVSAQQEKSAFEQSLERDTSVNSQESWVEIKGVRYRKVTFESGTYYMRFLSPDDTSVDLYCEPPFGFQSERLVVAETKVFKRTRAFVQAFHESCIEKNGQKVKKLHLNPAIGLTFPDQKGASLTNKKIMVEPFTRTPLKASADF